MLRTVLPQLYNETIKRKELIREVEMGPFKHEVGACFTNLKYFHNSFLGNSVGYLCH